MKRTILALLCVTVLILAAVSSYASVMFRGHFGRASNIPTASLSLSPSTINQGQSSTLTWGSARATSCTGTGFNTGGTTSGSLIVSPMTTTLYSLTCSNISGQGSASATLTVNPGVPVASLTASPNVIIVGSSSTLTWPSQNAISYTGTGFNTGNA